MKMNLAVFEPELPALADEIIEAIRREVPEYARPMRGEFGRGIRAGVVEALRRFGSEGDRSGVYRALGRGEHRGGRSLDALQSAYRVGARVAWRRLSAVAAREGVPIEEQHALAEAIFAYIDELAAESVEGYAAAQADVAGDRQRRREALLAALLAPVPTGAETLGALARDAGWRLPRRLVVLAVGRENPSDRRVSPPNPGGADAGGVARRLSGDVLHAEFGGRAVAVVPEPTPSLVAEATAAAERTGTRIAVGPAVETPEARRSHDWATRGLTLEGTVVDTSERLPDLLLAAQPEILQALRANALAPLDGETPNSRARLAATLRAWLDHAGARQRIAETLRVHPQTVRYRVQRLRELFGDALDDPDARFALQLALRSYPGP